MHVVNDKCIMVSIVD